jgi:hypothetical protein
VLIARTAAAAAAAARREPKEPAAERGSTMAMGRDESDAAASAYRVREPPGSGEKTEGIEKKKRDTSPRRPPIRDYNKRERMFAA